MSRQNVVGMFGEYSTPQSEPIPIYPLLLIKPLDVLDRWRLLKHTH